VSAFVGTSDDSHDVRTNAAPRRTPTSADTGVNRRLETRDHLLAQASESK
jgi:hypothetical protein